jgi:hypothetical protein
MPRAIPPPLPKDVGLCPRAVDSHQRIKVDVVKVDVVAVGPRVSACSYCTVIRRDAGLVTRQQLGRGAGQPS